MRRVQWAVLIILLMVQPALAGFEGYLEMKITAKDGAGTMKGYASGGGIRVEVSIRTAQTGETPVNLTLLTKFENPEVVYLLNDALRTYAEITPQDMRKSAGERPEKEYTVKKLGNETIAGYPCNHVLLTAKDGKQAEVWTTKALVDLTPWHPYMQRNRQSAELLGVLKALQAAQAEGFVAKMIVREPKTPSPTFTLDLLKAEKRPVAAAQLELPTGYSRQEGLLGMMPGMLPIPPEHQETLQKVLGSLSPERRKMLENLLRSTGGQ